MEKITDKYYLGSNNNTFILYEKRVSASGKEHFENIGYLTTLDSVYNTLLKKEIRGDLTVLNNIKKIVDLTEELKKFTVEYVEKHSKKE